MSRIGCSPVGPKSAAAPGRTTPIAGSRRWPPVWGLRSRLFWCRFEAKEAMIADAAHLLATTHCGSVSMAKMLSRPEVAWADLAARLPQLASVPAEVAAEVTYDAKYAGYIARQQIEVARQQRLASRRIPAGLDYSRVPHLSGRGSGSNSPVFRRQIFPRLLASAASRRPT